MDLELEQDQPDITFISECNLNEDHIDRALKTLREIQMQNQNIRNEIDIITSNPKVYVKAARDQIVSKINELRD